MLETTASHLAAAAEPTGGIAGWALGLMETLGAPGAGVAIALENLFPPLPSEVILPLAGFTAARGGMSLLAAVAWTTIGSVVGALALYWVGALLGRERIVAIAAKLPLVKVSDIGKTEQWFARHGTKAVFFGRFIPVFRSLISVPAGIERMPVATFLALTSLGSLIWNTLFVLAGYLLGENWHVVTEYVELYSKGVAIAVVLAVAGFATARLMKPGQGKRRARQP
jgi:membrane protein DedA with SNARE-associated domain